MHVMHRRAVNNWYIKLLYTRDSKLRLGANKLTERAIRVVEPERLIPERERALPLIFSIAPAILCAARRDNQVPHRVAIRDSKERCATIRALFRFIHGVQMRGPIIIGFFRN